MLTALAVAAAAFALGAHRADAQAVDRWPGVAAAYVVEVDGIERWSHAANARLRPASLTKILTALIVIESGGDDAIVTVSGRAASAQGARIGLRRGMQLRVGDLMTAMLLRSANDACLALAEHVARNEQAFVARMNAHASALGLADSHFENACGFDRPGTARRHAISRTWLASRWPTHGLRRSSGASGAMRARVDGRVFAFDNTNALIGRVDGARGVKTGWTQAAGRCLVAFAERRGTAVTLVLLGAPDRWWDAVAMIETAFEEARASPAPPK